MKDILFALSNILFSDGFSQASCGAIVLLFYLHLVQSNRPFADAVGNAQELVLTTLLILLCLVGAATSAGCTSQRSRAGPERNESENSPDHRRTAERAGGFRRAVQELAETRRSDQRREWCLHNRQTATRCVALQGRSLRPADAGTALPNRPPNTEVHRRSHRAGAWNRQRAGHRDSAE